MKPMGVGAANQVLTRYAERLERCGESPALAQAIRTMLAWRLKVLVEKYDFRPAQPYSAALTGQSEAMQHGNSGMDTK